MFRNQLRTSGLPRVGKFLGLDTLICGVGAASTLLAAYCFAADAPGQGSAEESGALEQIVVTAQRREENLTKVPISITAFSQKTMDDLHIQNFMDLAGVVPGLVVPPPQGGNQDSTDVAIRGIFSNGNAPTTQFYIDETPVAIRRLDGGGPSGSPHPLIFDLERVEVLRGPQGTLFGSSAMGGAIRYITPQPSLTDTSGYSKAEVGYTERGAPSYEVGAAYGGPIAAGTVGFRVSAWYQEAGGWIDRANPYTGEILKHNANSADSYVLRAAITFAPTENLTITPAVFFQHIYSQEPNAYWYQDTPNAQAAPNVRLDTLQNGGHVSGSFPEPGTDELRVNSIAIKYNFGGLTFQSDTSYLDRESNYLDDFTRFDEIIFGGTQFVPGINYNNFQSMLVDLAYTHSWQQEFRLSSRDPNSRVSWVAGVYYRRAVENLSQPIPGSLDVLTQAIAGKNTFEFTGYQNYYINGQPYNGFSYFHTIDVESALFGEINVEILSGLKANLGVRVEHSVVEDQHQLLAGPSDGATLNSNLLVDQVANPVTPRAGLTYQYTDQDMVYVSAGKGYRAGGGNTQVSTSSSLCGPSLAALGITGAPASFNSDSLWSYELGAKDTLFNRRLSFQASIYYIKWSDIQTLVSLPSCAAVFTANRGKAVSRGFDLQIEGIIAEGLKAGATVGYTDAYYPSAAYGAPSNGVTPLLNGAGDKLANVLPWTASANVEYSRNIEAVWGGARGYIRLDYRRLSAANALNPNVAGFDAQIGPLQNPAYGMLNIRLGAVHSGLDLSAYVNNATNADPIVGISHDGYPNSQLYAAAIRPLTFGLTALYRY
jgi:iron complex outermembrane recepter protein